jgi:hypothetical protein
MRCPLRGADSAFWGVSWHDVGLAGWCGGRSYARVCDRSAVAGPGWCGTGAGGEGRGDSGAAVPADGAARAGCPPEVHPDRLDGAGQPCDADVSRAVGAVPGHPGRPWCGGIGSWSVAAGPTPAGGRSGRRALGPAVVDLVLRLARGDPRWGYVRIVGGASSALRCPRHRYARSCAGIVWGRHPDAGARCGPGFCGRRPPGSWSVVS